MRTSVQALVNSIESFEKARDIVDVVLSLFEMLFFFGVTLKLVAEIDPKIVKQEELEADDIAIRLTGCRGVLIFAEMLKELRAQGYAISHESMLGFPALTIDERINFIRHRCSEIS